MLSAERSKVMTDPMLFFQVLKREHLHRCEYREMNILKAMWGGFTHAVREPVMQAALQVLLWMACV